MDPTTGIAVVFGTQIVPSPLCDAEVYGVFDRLEKLTYAGLQDSYL